MISGVRASSIRIEFDLVDDGVVVAALHHLGGRVFHVVAEIVEAELVVGAVGHVGGVFHPALVVVELMHDDADGEAQELVDGAHPGGVALGEVVVDGHHMHAAAGERIEIDGKRRHQSLAFAGLHLGDAALMQHHAAHELHVEMALADGALGGFAYRGESLRNQIFERSSVLDARAEVVGAGAQGLVGQRCDLRLELVDGGDERRVFLQLAVVGRAEHLAGQGTEGKHWTLASHRRSWFRGDFSLAGRKHLKRRSVVLPFPAGLA